MLVENTIDRIHNPNFIASHIMHSLSSLMILHCLVMILRNDSPFQAIQTKFCISAAKHRVEKISLSSQPLLERENWNFAFWIGPFCP